MTKFQGERNHLSLGRGMFSRVKAAEFPMTRIRYQNTFWATRLGLGDMLDDDTSWQTHFGQFQPLKGSLKAPLALAYHGHQFGVYNPDIGDGRGFLYGQCRDEIDGLLLDFGTKGSGQTPFSRQGDGRLTLKGAVREILATEMLDALGVNTSKTFSVIETGESLVRQDEPSPTRSAVLTRLSHGHIRVGSFQRLAHQGDYEGLERLLRYSVATYFHDVLDSKAPLVSLTKDFILVVAERLAKMTASWMAAGFVHGVLNTDNYNITGESFDYGPWRFLPNFRLNFTAAYFDHGRRYAFGRQPMATSFALNRLGECLANIGNFSEIEEAAHTLESKINNATYASLMKRFGIVPDWEDAPLLARELFTAMQSTDENAAHQSLVFENLFFDWYGGSLSKKRALESPRREFYQGKYIAPLIDLLSNAPAAEDMNVNHPYFSDENPETMLIDEVEEIWEDIATKDDWTALQDKIKSIHRMATAYGRADDLPLAIVRS